MNNNISRALERAGRATDTAGKTAELANKALNDLKKEREKCNELVQQIDLIGGVLTCVLKKHKYTEIKLNLEEVRQAVKLQQVGVRGLTDERSMDTDQILIWVENKPQNYDDIVGAENDTES